MGVRTGGPRARSGARLAAAGCGALTVLAATTACSAAGGATASGSSSAAPRGSFYTAVAPGSSVSTSPSASPVTEPATSPVVIGSPSPSASPSATPVPVAAPATGGGGTAGVQDILLFGLGGAALLAGAGSLAYRRRAMRDR